MSHIHSVQMNLHVGSHSTGRVILQVKEPIGIKALCCMGEVCEAEVERKKYNNWNNIEPW